MFYNLHSKQSVFTVFPILSSQLFRVITKCNGDYQREKGRWWEVEMGKKGINGVGRRLDLEW